MPILKQLTPSSEIDPNEAGILAQRLRSLMLHGACERLEIGDDFVVTLRHPDPTPVLDTPPTPS